MGNTDRTRSALASMPRFVGSIGPFLSELESRRGRKIVVTDLPAGTRTGTLCGMWLPMDSADLVFIAPNLVGPHRDHVVLHEVAHMVLGHELGMVGAMTAVSPELAARILARTAYSDPQEREAEHLASLVMSGSRGEAQDSWVADPRWRRAATVFGSG